MKEYLWKEFRYNVHSKYYKFFEEWYNNLTDNQIIYYTAYSMGLKSPYLEFFDNNKPRPASSAENDRTLPSERG